jgi:hypothetical protein
VIGELNEADTEFAAALHTREPDLIDRLNDDFEDAVVFVASSRRPCSS